jgi:hypothetical protein
MKRREACAGSPTEHGQLSTMISIVSPSSHFARFQLQQNQCEKAHKQSTIRDDISVNILQTRINTSRQNHYSGISWILEFVTE